MVPWESEAGSLPFVMEFRKLSHPFASCVQQTAETRWFPEQCYREHSWKMNVLTHHDLQDSRH